MARRTRVKWKNVLVAALAVMLLVGAVAGIASIKSDDSVKISELTFSVGALDEQGMFVEYNRSVVSDYFECQGLTIEPTANASGSYQVFYYTNEKVFFGSTEELSPRDGIYKMGRQYCYAKYARVVYTPSVPLDEYGAEVDSFRIRFFEASSYAGNIVVSVDREQSYLFDEKRNVFKEENVLAGQTYKSYSGTGGYSLNSLSTLTADSGWNTIKPITIPEKATRVFVFYDGDDMVLEELDIAFGNKDRAVVFSGSLKNSSDMTFAEWDVCEFELGADNTIMVLEFTKLSDFQIFFAYD